VVGRCGVSGLIAKLNLEVIVVGALAINDEVVVGEAEGSGLEI
jgi:hypothetical protein